MQRQVFEAAMSGDASAMAILSQEALREGQICEAAYWSVMAEIRGYPPAGMYVGSCIQVWMQAGRPMDGNEFGFHAMEFLAGVSAGMARIWFQRERIRGNRDAGEFLMFYSSAV